MHSETLQDYVKNIYMLQAGDGRATTSGVAERLGVSAASATAMFKKLAEAGLVEHRPYHGAVLTDAGERMAVEVLRHHRLLELYLTQALGMPWETVHGEADRLEHVLSEELEAAMDAALGYPDTDPHGDPIPSVDLVVRAEDGQPLAGLEPGQIGIVRRVPDSDPELLRYLGGLGLVPSASFTLVAKELFGGTVTLEIAGARHSLGLPVAERIRVEVAA
jgi:DtxR family transcriptional regulator, Mn-dependent transcriptional regulator